MREGWEYKKLGEVAAFYRGLTYTGKDEVDFSNNVVLRSNNVDLVRNTLNLNELKYISDEITIPNDKMVKKGSILMCMSNGSKQHIGKVAYINKDYNCAFGGFMGLIIPNENYIIPKLLYYYCCSCTFKQFVLSIVNGANINNLRFSDLSNKTVPIPSFSIQSVILSELDMITEMISKYDEQLKELDKLSQSIFYEMFGDPVENEKGWEVKMLGDINAVSSSKRILVEDMTNKGIPFLRGTELTLLCSGHEFDEIEYPLNISQKQYDDVKKLTGVPLVGDLLIPSINSNGYVWKVNTSKQFYFKDGRVIWVHVNKKCFSSEYLRYLLMIQLKNVFDKMNGATFAEFKLFVIRELIVVCPPLALQQSFARKIEAIETMKSKVREAKKEAETLLAARMQYWFE